MKKETTMRKVINQGKRKRRVILVLLILVILFTFLCLFVGSSHMSVSECFAALFRTEAAAGNIRIIWNIRIPRVLAALIAGAGLSVSGLMMQTTLNNPMASPATLGVTNAAVFGANVSIIAFAGGFLATGHNLTNFMTFANPFATSLMAFFFSLISVLLILLLCRVQSFSPGVVVLAGIAMGSVFSAGTTILQFFATDVGISAAVIWNFGDLGRATYQTDLLMLVVVLLGILFFSIQSCRYNALLNGDTTAFTMGVNVKRLRFFTLLTASLITAVCVSFLGVIGFVGIICPHTIKKLLGQDHRFSIPASALSGSLLLLAADTLSRSIGNGTALPVGAITTLLGAPFFIGVIVMGRGNRRC